MTNFIHKPVMEAEVLEALAPRTDGRYVDGTLGGAGHATAILRASAPSGWLYGCDQDGAAISVAEQRLAEFAGRFEIRRGSFADLSDWVPAGSCDGCLLDLGVSSPQLDQAERGFSFQQDGPLDMRMDQRQARTAAVLVNEAPVEELARIFWQYGDERESRRFARAIGMDRVLKKFETTGQLAGLIERLSPRMGRKSHPATKVFQALRIAVNDEMGALEKGLSGALTILKSGGRLAVITFHSLEDRMVKEFGRNAERDYSVDGPVDVPALRRPKVPLLRRVNRKAICPGEEELRMNPRARSAQLRVFEKI
ncbi:MAG TPA: 16S rRNA (cytosine(1402)-N(4))-methyltransferase RsmH [Roseimicrobium sp.]|nr:16S rRNA (cytosine(1402)-N(4))-methyltransferase RsmH [Roseimicrobium sp.]